MAEIDYNWGEKHNYYADGRKRKGKKGEEEENVFEEEEEAKRIQEIKLQKFKDAVDFDDNMEDKQSSQQDENSEVNLSEDNDDEALKTSFGESERVEVVTLLENLKANLERNKEFAQIKTLLTQSNLEKPAKFFKSKQQIINLLICNVVFFLILRSKNPNCAHHPVFKRILLLKRLLEKSDQIEEAIEPNLTSFIESLEFTAAKQESLLSKKKPRNVEVEELPEELNLYEENMKKVNSLKLQSQKNKEKGSRDLDKEIDFKEEAGLREANNRVLRAKGITRKRKKHHGNAKLHYREKFFKKMNVRKNLVKEYTSKPEVYSGEGSGIRRDLIRSTKLS